MLTDAQRRAVEAQLLPALQARYPSRAVRIEWDENDTLVDRKTATFDHDGVET